MTKQQLKFHGNLSEFKQFMTDLGLTGKWRQIANNGHQFKETSGAAISWWPSTKTIQVDGNEPAKSTVRKQIADALKAGPRSGSTNDASDADHSHIDDAQAWRADSSEGTEQPRGDGWHRFAIRTAGGSTVYGYFNVKPK